MKIEMEAGRGRDMGEVNEKRREEGTTSSGCITWRRSDSQTAREWSGESHRARTAAEHIRTEM